MQDTQVRRDMVATLHALIEGGLPVGGNIGVLRVAPAMKTLVVDAFAQAGKLLDTGQSEQAAFDHTQPRGNVTHPLSSRMPTLTTVTKCSGVSKGSSPCVKTYLLANSFSGERNRRCLRCLAT